jgi:parallel beta-helix repeat protein
MPGNWGALVIHKNSTASSLSHCMIRHAKNGVRFLANKVGGGTIGGTVSNCSLTENEMGVYMYGNPGYPAGGTIVLNPTIRNNLIHENYEYGIYVQASTGYGTTRNEALIENNVITFNAGGIYLKGNSWWLGHADVFTIIKNNTIRESLADGIYIEAEGSSDASGSDTDVQPVVENNLLENNGIGNIRLLLDPLGNDGIQILQPVIRYNTIRNAANGIWIKDTGNQDTLNPIIAFNVFYNLGSYTINNLTNRAISAQSNYWGDSEAAWDAGPQPGDTYGSVNTSNYLTTTAAPVLTRIVPAAAQPGEEAILFGANFGS